MPGLLGYQVNRSTNNALANLFYTSCSLVGRRKEHERLNLEDALTLESALIECRQLMAGLLGYLQRLLNRSPTPLGGSGDRLDDELGALTGIQVRTQFFSVQSDCPFQALAGDAGAGDTAEDGGFGRADVVAVEAGDGEGLEDVEFDQLHVLLSVDG